MEALEYKIIMRKKELEAVLEFALAQNPVYLPVVRAVKLEIHQCNRVLKQIIYLKTRAIGA